MTTFKTKTPPEEFDYVFEAPGFREYFESRSGYRLQWSDMGWRWLCDVALNPKAPPPDRAWFYTRVMMQALWEIWPGRPVSPPPPPSSPAGQLTFF